MTLPEKQVEKNFNRRDIIIACILFLLIFTWYSILPIAWQNYDTVPLSKDLVLPWTLYLGCHPHHLIHYPVLKATYQIAGWIRGIFIHNSTLDALAWLQAVNNFLGAINVGLTYLTLRKLFPRTAFALPSAIAFAFAYTFMHFSLDGAQYMPALPWIWLTYLLLPWRPAPLKNYRPSIIALTIACLFHQVSVFTIFAVIAHAFCFSDTDHPAIKARFRSCLIVGAVSALTIAIPYFLLLAYATWAYSRTGPYAETYRDMNIFQVLILYGTQKESYWAPDFITGFLRNITAFYQLWVPWDSEFLKIARPIVMAALVGPPVLIIGTACMLPRAINRIRYIVLIALSSILAYSIFQTFWGPWFYVFKLWILLPIIILMISGIETARENRAGSPHLGILIIYWLWVLILIAVNIFGLTIEWINADIQSPF